MLLVRVAPAASGRVRDDIEDLLGTDAEHARWALDELLADPPDVIRAEREGVVGAVAVGRCVSAIPTRWWR
ncbi:hypothetical protein I546_5464 [Mycobacterium kansasii 732]|uniref:hypothetical protein n=1 Tax=Mycobacterium pseudokansasii TaxID=2341080 RepID=UPI0004460C09|nr:hypothetical protein [Mycobacterium pseudokansasii]EUA06446.1 hypothetical protein I546_5464 [Mycobacterium kansasii 732]KZS63880.1 hypothetical protein A4G27_01005 [Mycobacterium kansasii]MBY0391400.1 hypothetical protein [Mycobacterium pseudokansasii]